MSNLNASSASSNSSATAAIKFFGVQPMHWFPMHFELGGAQPPAIAAKTTFDAMYRSGEDGLPLRTSTLRKNGSDVSAIRRIAEENQFGAIIGAADSTLYRRGLMIVLPTARLEIAYQPRAIQGFDVWQHLSRLEGHDPSFLEGICANASYTGIRYLSVPVYTIPRKVLLSPGIIEELITRVPELLILGADQAIVEALPEHVHNVWVQPNPDDCWSKENWLEGKKKIDTDMEDALVEIMLNKRVLCIPVDEMREFSCFSSEQLEKPEFQFVHNYLQQSVQKLVSLAFTHTQGLAAQVLQANIQRRLEQRQQCLALKAEASSIPNEQTPPTLEETLVELEETQPTLEETLEEVKKTDVEEAHYVAVGAPGDPLRETLPQENPPQEEAKPPVPAKRGRKKS